MYDALPMAFPGVVLSTLNVTKRCTSCNFLSREHGRECEFFCSFPSNGECPSKLLKTFSRSLLVNFLKRSLKHAAALCCHATGRFKAHAHIGEGASSQYSAVLVHDRRVFQRCECLKEVFASQGIDEDQRHACLADSWMFANPLAICTGKLIITTEYESICPRCVFFLGGGELSGGIPSFQPLHRGQGGKNFN